MNARSWLLYRNWLAFLWLVGWWTVASESWLNVLMMNGKSEWWYQTVCEAVLILALLLLFRKTRGQYSGSTIWNTQRSTSRWIWECMLLFVVRVHGKSSNLNFYEIHNLNQRNLISTSDIPNCQSRRNKLTPNLVGWFCQNVSRFTFSAQFSCYKQLLSAQQLVCTFILHVSQSSLFEFW